MLLETTVAAMLIGAAIVLVARLVGGLAAVNENAGHRAWALNEARNTLERLAAQPWVKLDDPGAAEAWSRGITERASEALPGGSVEVAIEPEPDDPDTLRLAVEVRWDGPSGIATRPVRLVAWAYRQARGGAR